jgi:lipoyl(octanoyl) transferase
MIRAFDPLELQLFSTEMLAPRPNSQDRGGAIAPASAVAKFTLENPPCKVRLVESIEIRRRKADVPPMKLAPRIAAPGESNAFSPLDTGVCAPHPRNSDATLLSAPRPGVRASAPFAARNGAPTEWVISEGLTEFEAAVAEMESRAAAIAMGKAAERVWLVEHPPLYTAGTSAREHDLIGPVHFPVFKTGRGGQFTYHGPGQRVAYVMLDLSLRKPDLRAFVHALEDWIIRTLSSFNIRGERREGRIGVWVPRPAKGDGIEDKIAAIGIRVRRWVSFHGVSINVEPELSHYRGIVPCGIRGHGVTSLADLGWPVSVPELDAALRVAFEEVFGETRSA